MYEHPNIIRNQPVPFLQVILLESVSDESKLLEREVFWQTNFGTLSDIKTKEFLPLNDRKDFNSL